MAYCTKTQSPGNFQGLEAVAMKVSSLSNLAKFVMGCILLTEINRTKTIIHQMLSMLNLSLTPGGTAPGSTTATPSATPCKIMIYLPKF